MQRSMSEGSAAAVTTVAARTGLLPAALACLTAAAAAKLSHQQLLREERSVRQPDSWLIERCCQALADLGAGEEALAVAQWVAARQPQALPQTLYRLAQHAAVRPHLLSQIGGHLDRLRGSLFSPWLADEAQQAERLLLTAATAARIGRTTLAFACLERLDQLPLAWRRIFGLPEQRALLAEAVACAGLHPLTTWLIARALPRFQDDGAHFLQAVAAVAAAEAQTGPGGRAGRVLQRCVQTVQAATLGSLMARRYAASVLARAGLTTEVLAQVTTIATIQEAHRQSGLKRRDSDDTLLRQVSRSRADTDIDFQVYTLQEALKALPANSVPQAERQELTARLVDLGVRSDGWTAASTAAALLRCGAARQASQVVERIARDDATRTEGVISLVRGLLEMGELEQAAQEVEKALGWVQATKERGLERTTVWGLADAYLVAGRPDRAQALLERRRKPGLWHRLRHSFEKTVDEEQLREDRLRLQICLHHAGRDQNQTLGLDADTLFREIQEWAPRLLEGEALVSYYARVLQPLLAAGLYVQVWELLPQVGKALAALGGGKHAARLAEIAALLQPVAGDETARLALSGFLTELWQEDARRGIWQAIYGLTGSLPLILALDGPHTLVEIARFAAAEGGGWYQQLHQPLTGEGEAE